MMMECKECSHVVSSGAERCMKCGARAPWSVGFTMQFWILVTFFICLFALAGVVGK